MANGKLAHVAALLATFGLSGCGFTVPEMRILSPDSPEPNEPLEFSGRAAIASDHVKPGV